MTESLLTVSQAAQIIGCSRATVAAAITAGHLPAFSLPPAYRRQGRKRYLKQADVEAFARTYTGRPGPRPQGKRHG